MNLRAIWLIARSVLVEAIRRREVYVIVLLTTLLIGSVMTVEFFQIDGLTKFYREVALKMMSIATAITVIVLASRQLPREFEQRTIYPLLARPISRPVFLLGKLLGVMLAAGFCIALFMIVFVLGTWRLGGTIPWALFVQCVYLMMVEMLVLATLCFWLSMLFNFDAAVTIGVLFFAFASTFSSISMYIYAHASSFGQAMLVGLNYAIPQMPLFDLSGRAVHGEAWEMVRFTVMASVTLYGLFYAGLYFAFAIFCFRRRAL